jgi:hypothetical protein
VLLTCSPRIVDWRFDGVGDNERGCTLRRTRRRARRFVVRGARLGVGGLYVEGRRRGVRRRPGVGRTHPGTRRLRVVRRVNVDSVRDAVLSELVDALSVPHEGRRGWG